jgi:hypothetical protein
LLHLSVPGSGSKHNQLWKSYKISFSCHKQISNRNWDPEIEMQSSLCHLLVVSCD